MLLETTHVAYPAWWFAVAGALLLLGLAVAVVGVLRWRALAPRLPELDDSLEQCRREALDDIDEAATFSNPRATCQQISRVTRRFVGLASDGDADYASAQQLRRAARLDPRLEKVATLVSETQEACFAPSAQPDVAEVAERAREVVKSWR